MSPQPVSTTLPLTISACNHQWLQRSLPICRALLIMGAVMFLLYGTVDWLIDPASLRQTLPLRFATSSVFLLVFGLSYTPYYVRYFSAITIALSVLSCALLTLIFFAILQAPWAGIGSLLLMSIAVMSLNGHLTVFVTSMLLTWLLPGVAIIVILPNARDVLFFNYILATSMAAGLYIGLQMRQQFVYALKLEQRLALEAATDSLTGLANRRAFFDASEREWQEVQRHHQSLAVLMIDIDKFKTLNDQYGHAKGDAVLQRVATQMLAQLRANDFAARIGGEEFAILLPHESATSAHVVAERLREAVARYRADVTCTVSIGVAVSDPDHHEFLQLLKRADQALYEAKQNGRNRVCIAR